MDASQFMAALRREFPHLAAELDSEDGLLHLKTGCFKRYTQTQIDTGNREGVKRCFDFARRSWIAGDNEVQNALGVSFLEHLNFHDGRVSRAWAWDLLPGILQANARSLGVAPDQPRRS